MSDYQGKRFTLARTMVALFVTIFASGIAVADDHEGGSAGFIASIMIFAVVLVLVAAVMFFAQ